MKRTSKSILAAWRAGLVLLCFLPAGAAAQGTSGEAGKMPDPAPPISREGGVSADPSSWKGPLTRPLRCFVEYFVTTEERRPVESCAEVDYGSLYDQALSMADALSKLRCEAGCGPLKKYQVAREWDCFEGTAYARILWGVSCPDPKDPPTRDLGRPTAGSFKEPYRYHRDGRWQYVEDSDLGLMEMDEIPLDCPCRRFVKFTYDERADCNDVKFEDGPYLARASNAAENWFESISCPKPCIRSNWSDAFVYKKWGCDAVRFRVEYILKLSCD